MEICYEWGNVSMANQNQLLLRLIAAFCVCALPTTAVHAWSDPILVTPDTTTGRNSRVVFDSDGNMHFFFISNRYQVGMPARFDVFHCKYSRNGERMTEDLRLDTTSSNYWTYPSPVFGNDGKLHVAWGDYMNYPWIDSSGIFYARLDANGNIEREATRIFRCLPDPPRLFQDTEGNLNVVWINLTDSLYYGKFDTSGQVLIPETLVYEQPEAPGNLYYMRACSDDLDQFHVIYRHDWGYWTNFNLGYSRVNNQGEVLIPYAPLTPEVSGQPCAIGHIIADDDNNLNLLYLQPIPYNEGLMLYRKMDQNLNLLFEIQLVDYPYSMSGTAVGDGDIALDAWGNVVMVWRDNDGAPDPNYLRATYTTGGLCLIPPETIIEGNVLNPDLALNTLNGMAVFNFTWSVDSLPAPKVFYCYEVDYLAVSPKETNTLPINIQLSIFPNPFNDQAIFQLQNSRGGDLHVKLMDAAGRMVCDYGKFFLQGKRDFVLDKPLASGVYYLLVREEQETLIQSVIHLK